MRAFLAAPLLAALSALATADASAQSFRCRNDLADVGDNKAAILAKCGEPVAKDSSCKGPTNAGLPDRAVQPSVSVPCETVDEWTYRPASGQLMTTLRFESGRLQSIRYGDRVR